jgi:hypothetical protein
LPPRPPPGDAPFANGGGENASPCLIVLLVVTGATVVGVTEPMPEIDPPAGVEIVTWPERPELAPGLYAVACEAYPDVPGDEATPMDPYEQWLSNDMQGDSDRPDATFIALFDGEVGGYAKLSLSRSDPKVAYHDMTGVRRELRSHR